MSKRGDSAVRWREIVWGHADSGLSVAAYCRRARVSEASFYSWRRKLQRCATFAKVRIASEPLSTGDALDVRLPNGRVIVVRPGFDRQTLRDLVATLEVET